MYTHKDFHLTHDRCRSHILRRGTCPSTLESGEARVGTATGHCSSAAIRFLALFTQHNRSSYYLHSLEESNHQRSSILTFIFFASCYRRVDRCYGLPFLTLLSTKSTNGFQPTVYLYRRLAICHEDDVCNAPLSVTFRYCLKTIPHIIILSSRHESDIPSLPGRQVSSSQSGGITPRCAVPYLPASRTVTTLA